ncbi:MAG TPA: hypothetical protein VGK38_15435 [Prolixibacteraceae bacterium]|jgi:hypothetical protein
MKKTVLPLVFFILSGCYYDSEEALYGKPGTGVCDTSVAKFHTQIEPILSSYCLSCHSNSAALSSGGGVKLQDYASVFSVRARLIGSIKHATGFSAMPKGGGSLSVCDISIISAWNINGALNN